MTNERVDIFFSSTKIKQILPMITFNFLNHPQLRKSRSGVYLRGIPSSGLRLIWLLHTHIVYMAGTAVYPSVYPYS